jgi:hypothetical protein
MTGQLLMNLLQVSTTTGLSGNVFESDGTTAVKVYHWNVWQSNTPEAVVYHILSTNPNRCKSGVSYIDDVLVQVSIWNANGFEAATIANNIRAILEGWEGTFEDVLYYKILLESQVETFDDETKYYGVIQTWTISNAR